MNDRNQCIARFLGRTGWDTATSEPIIGDASPRRYFRLTHGEQSAILMDAPPEAGPDVTARFSRMAFWLRSHGFSAPEILVEDHANGILIIEDLGDALIARLVVEDPLRDRELTTVATGFLADLGKFPPPDFVEKLDGPALAELVSLTPRWYLAGIGAVAPKAAHDLPKLIEREYDRLSDGRYVLSLRDFHAENLIWLPDRIGTARLGLLDFQDAVAAHPAYDLVSLLQDARRDVSDATERKMIARFTQATGVDPGTFGAIYALLGAQRALRIIGVFSRLVLHFGKPRYLDLMTRVWGYLARDLVHPELSELAALVHETLPEPTPERIERIRSQCGQFPTP
ncbi:MAG: phosphotransferase [Paracoccaceae bacterium]